ncbi:MAG TPA: ABC transporter permease [Mucilaginibacter sp.]|nr:ABC transporter permease [Mucilaginibacter sp.]
MIRNYIKTTLRSLLKNKSYSFLNIAGLAIGITCASLIFLWVQDEITFNHNFSKRDHLYRVMENQHVNGVSYTIGTSPEPMGNAIKAEIPGIKNTMRKSWNMDELFVLGDKSINENGAYADPSIFSMLTLPFVYGNPNEAFKETHSVVISETMSKKFFGDKDPVGKTILLNAKQNYSVDGTFIISGVFKDLPSNSTFQFQWLSAFDLWVNKNSWLRGQWGNNLTETYAEVQPSANVNSIDQKLKNYLAGKNKGNTNQLFLFPMNDWNLHNNFTDGKEDGGKIRYVKLFSTIAWIILLIACINFMNLSTARSEQRAKEVGVRKVMGAGKGKLVGQFIGESLIMSFIAVLVAVASLYLLLPAFNGLVEKQLTIELFNPIHLGFLIGIGVITGLIAGSYPAFYLSSFNPVYVLKGIRVKAGSGVNFIRKGLVVSQFVISIVLIISTIIIYQQVNHVKARNLGYNKDNLINMNLQGDLKDHYSSVKNDLLSTGVVENTTMSQFLAVQIYSSTDEFKWQGKDPNNKVVVNLNLVAPDYIKTMGIKLLEGRDFYTESRVDSTNIIINQSLAKKMGKMGHLGSTIISGQFQLKVVGIVNDMIYNNMYGEAAPFMLICNPGNVNSLTIRIKPGTDISQAIEKIGNVIKKDNPGYPFEYTFMDEEFAKLFKSETLVSKLASVFAVLAIFISCLGLFGLAAYTAGRRIKEIGIRKVLGASVSGLVSLLSKDFLQLVALSCLIAFPVAWWAMSKWLQDYQYRIEIHWWVFATAGVLALVIAQVTVSFQAIKAALINPVKSLRSE